MSYFIYDRRTQTIKLDEDKTISVADFKEWMPSFKPPTGIDQLVYIPGVRVSIHKGGDQLGLPEIANQEDQTQWADGDRYIQKAIDVWAYHNDKAARAKGG